MHSATTWTTELRVLWRPILDEEYAWIEARTPANEEEAQEWAAKWRADECEVRIQRRLVSTTPWIDLPAELEKAPYA